MPIKLIADSGSTKTDWRYISSDGKITQASTQGFNPYFQTTAQIEAELRNKLLPQLNGLDISNPSIHFYGAGCSSPAKVKEVYTAIEAVFPKSTIEVEHDLLGAARALCGRESGIAAILGTGSNSCFYDGNKIVHNVASLGYLLGDEGSGAYIGKAFIKKYLDKEVPGQIAENFYNRYKLSKEDILDAVYKQPLPNRFLAGFSKFVYQNLKDPFIVQLVETCFNDFFEKHICKYENYQSVKFNCVGSVGFYYSNILTHVASQKGIVVGTILETPIAGLTLYHSA